MQKSRQALEDMAASGNAVWPGDDKRLSTTTQSARAQGRLAMGADLRADHVISMGFDRTREKKRPIRWAMDDGGARPGVWSDGSGCVE